MKPKLRRPSGFSGLAKRGIYAGSFIKIPQKITVAEMEAGGRNYNPNFFVLRPVDERLVLGVAPLSELEQGKTLIIGETHIFNPKQTAEQNLLRQLEVYGALLKARKEGAHKKLIVEFDKNTYVEFYLNRRGQITKKSVERFSARFPAQKGKTQVVETTYQLKDNVLAVKTHTFLISEN